jgi:peroxiredoxin
MPNATSRRTAAALPFFSLAVAAYFVGNAGPAHAQATGALTTAKTISVKETFRTAHQSGDPLVIAGNVTVEIAGANKVKVLMIPPDGKGKQLFYIADGSKFDHDFNGFAGPGGQYNVLDATAEARAHEVFRQLAAVDTILNPDPKDTAPANITRTVTTDTLDGKPMILRTDVQPTMKSGGGKVIVFSQKFWFDAATGFPVRRSDYTTIDGKTDCVTQLDFSDWKLDIPIPPAEFAFVAPAGSEETPHLLAAGTTAPDFAVTTPNGKTVHLSDYRGKAVILDFWATWCGPCQESLPHLEHVYQQVKEKGVTVLAVCVWDKKTEYDKWMAVNAGKKYHFPFAFDPAAQDQDNSIAAKLYHATGIPVQYLIDKNGKVAASTTGYGEGDHRLEDNLRQLGIAVPAAATVASAHP